MVKSGYTQELAQWVNEKEKSKPPQDKSLVAFLAVKSNVQEAIDAGYSLKTIWQHMHDTGRLPYRYETFLRHVKKHLAKTAEIPPSPPVDKGQSKPSDPAPGSIATRPQGFAFNPTPNTKELL